MKLRTRWCAKCGHIQDVPTRQRTCLREPNGPSHNACGGKLTDCVHQSKEALASKADPRPARSVQEEATADLRHAERMIDRKAAAMAKVSRQLAEWVRKAKHYRKEAALTDAQVEARKAQARQRAEIRKQSRKVRGIKIP